MRLTGLRLTVVMMSAWGASRNLSVTDSRIARFVTGDVRVERAGSPLPLLVGDVPLLNDRIAATGDGIDEPTNRGVEIRVTL